MEFLNPQSSAFAANTRVEGRVSFFTSGALLSSGIGGNTDAAAAKGTLAHCKMAGNLFDVSGRGRKTSFNNNTEISSETFSKMNFTQKCLYTYPGPRGFLLFFIGKFCDTNRFFYFIFLLFQIKKR